MTTKVTIMPYKIVYLDSKIIACMHGYNYSMQGLETQFFCYFYIKFPALASVSPKAFSDDLSPTALAAWLSQQFQAKGLTLESSLRQKLIGKLCN